MLNSSIAVKTKQAHAVGINVFETFCHFQKLQNVWHQPGTHITRFIAYLSLSGYKHSTAQSYIAAISFYTKAFYNVDPVNHFITRKLLQGMQRTLPNKDSRLPITLELLNTILPTLQTVCNTIFESKLLTAAFPLAFYALLRIGEITLSKGNTAASILQFHDISLQQAEIQLTIRHSKTDQLGIGTILRIPASKGMACPLHYVLCTIIYRSLQLKLVHCSFILKTRYQFITILKRCLDVMGVDRSNYNSYSFRIGLATTLALQGVDYNTIQGSGRWCSNAFRTYIR